MNKKRFTFLTLIFRKHPITQHFYSVVANVKMGDMEIRRAIRVRMTAPVQWGNNNA